MNNRVGIVVIGRNEASRLEACLRSVGGDVQRSVYVDSGSQDRSAEIAEELGVGVVRLTAPPYSAARGRRAGVEFVRQRFRDADLVQFIDGDCELDEAWIRAGSEFLEANPRAAVVAGRLREKHPERSIWTRLTDMEWELPVGQVDVIGGISLMRIEALLEVGGWRDDLVTGEELDLSTRLRDAEWTIHRLATPMCTHDVGITRFREFWKRSLRAGYGYCNLTFMHWRSGPRRWLRRTLGSLAYGLVLPLGIVGTAFIAWPVSVLFLLAYLSLPAKLCVARLRRGDGVWVSSAHAVVSTVCKSAMAMGVLRCLRERALRRDGTLIEYKGPNASASARTRT